MSANAWDTAQPLLEESLAQATEANNKGARAATLADLGTIAHARGDLIKALSLQHEALTMRSEIGHAPGAIESLEALAHLSCDTGRFDRAARLFAAATTQRQSLGYAPTPAHRTEQAAAVTTVRDQLGSEQFDAAWAEGAALAGGAAIAYAAKGRGLRVRARTGWGSLTRAELGVARLVAEGLTNADIASSLFISPRTVQAHMAHIFEKLHLTSRQQVVREVSRHEG